MGSERRGDARQPLSRLSFWLVSQLTFHHYLKYSTFLHYLKSVDISFLGVAKLLTKFYIILFSLIHLFAFWSNY